LYNEPVIFKRKLAKDKKGHYRLSIPSELVRFLDLNEGGDLAIIPDTTQGSLTLRVWADEAV
jgi:bifunctional DNA-binding transcriptional regulator/antitoxin component of YhaV-PrlF toxin-antitoxin module